MSSGLCKGCLAVSYFHTAFAALASALRRFTVLFGMERRGATSLFPPDLNLTLFSFALLLPNKANFLYGISRSNDRIKPLESLVSLSSTLHNAYTRDLSTSSSRTSLLGTLVPGSLIFRQVSRLDAFSGSLFRT